jgi:hypothetical protein
MAAGASSCTLANGNFGSPSGSQIITVDYDIPAKTADFACSLAGTAVTSMVLLNGPDVEHTATALVAMNFVDEHYANGLGTIAANDAWSTGSPSGTGFASKTSDLLYYIRLGKLVYCFVNIQGTSNATTFTFTLPVAAKRTTESLVLSGLDNNSRNGVRPRLETTASSTTANVAKDEDGNVWTASSIKMVQGHFFYEAA